MNTRIISFSGRKGSGKTELANICVQNGYTLINFADALKNLICNILNISRELLEINKETIKVYKLDENQMNIISDNTNIDINIVKNILEYVNFNSIRMLLQIIGTELIRQYNPLWHIKSLENTISKNKFYCIGDCRFKNEKECVEKLGGKCWFIIRPNNMNISNHQSEIDLQWPDFENIIINNTSKKVFIETFEYYLKTGIRPVSDEEKNQFINKRYFYNSFNYKYKVNENNQIIVIDHNDKERYETNPFIIENIKKWLH